MKFLLALFFLTFQTIASAEFCTAVIKDLTSGYEYENYTRNSYSHDDACYIAMSDCRFSLGNAQAQGRYYNANCFVVDNYPPTPPNQSLTCATDLVDQVNRIVRRFTATSNNGYEACLQSDQFCKMAIARGPNYGLRCINEGIINGGNYPNPPMQTAECTVSRVDPNGKILEKYLGRAQGPRGTDVYHAACNVAIENCAKEALPAQTCKIDQ